MLAALAVSVAGFGFTKLRNGDQDRNRAASSDLVDETTAASYRDTAGPSPSAVVVNVDRVDDPGQLRAVLVAALTEAGWPAPDWRPTTAADHGAGLARAAVAGGARVVISCGGDGTVLECLEELAGSDAALALVALGTSNLLARNLGIPSDPAAAMAIVTEGQRRRIDLGRLHDAGGTDRLFAVAAGIGFDATMIEAAPAGLKGRLGWVAYLAAALRHLRDPAFPVELVCDGRPLGRRMVRSVLVANVGRLPAGLTLAPDAVPDDGLLDVVVLSPRRLRDWLGLGIGLLRGQRHARGVEHLRAAAVSVTARSPQPREIDGDPVPPSATLQVSVCPTALILCVPLGGASGDLTRPG